MDAHCQRSSIMKMKSELAHESTSRQSRNSQCGEEFDTLLDSYVMEFNIWISQLTEKRDMLIQYAQQQKTAWSDREAAITINEADLEKKVDQLLATIPAVTLPPGELI